VNYIVTTLRANPELAVFLTLALGFLLGKLRIGSFTLGNVVGTLLAGVLIGQLGIQVAPVVKTVFFALFLFATGYKVGPQFFRGLKKNALPQAILTVVLCVASLVTTIVISKLMHYDCGTAAGLMAGAFTESTVIGTAGDTIARLDIPGDEKTRLLNNIPVAYAVSYLVGTGFVVWFLSVLAPKMLRVNLKDESKKIEAAAGRMPPTPAATISGYREWDLRAYSLRGGPFVDTSVSAYEQAFLPERVVVERIRREGEILDAGPETMLKDGDTIALSGKKVVHSTWASVMGEEVDDRELLEFPIVIREVVLTRREATEQELFRLAEQFGRGIALLELMRGGEQIPFSRSTTLNRGDVLTIAGRPAAVERAGAALGAVEQPGDETDVVFISLGIVLGGLIGAATVVVAGLPLSLTASGGALIMGLVFGWMRSVRPTFGRIPDPALWVFDTVGLAVFIGIVGLTAGPTFVEGLKTTGPSLLVAGFVVAIVPHAVSVLIGRYALKMNPLILLGACAGAGTLTAALRAIQDEADSKVPVLGYTVPYALGNILLTAWGPVIVAIMK
jgi:putative transport protein